MIELYDISKCSVGSVNIARASRISGIGASEGRVASLPNAMRGKRIDTVKQEIKPSIQAQDPLAVPLVIALTGTQSGVFGGIDIADGSYQDWTLLHLVLIGAGFQIQHRQPGTCSLDLQNRATTGNEVADECAGAAGTAQAIVTRDTFLEIVSAVFTDDASTAITPAGVRSLSWQGRPDNVYAETSGGAQILVDQLAVSANWAITGSMNIAGSALSTAQSAAQELCAARRGTLVATVMPMGQATGATPPVNKIVTMQRVKFYSPRLSLGSQAPGSWDVDFDCEMISAAGALLTLAQTLTMADAT